MYHGLGPLAPIRYELDLSNGVLNTQFGQGTAKISEVKVGDRKKICQFSLTLGAVDVDEQFTIVGICLIKLIYMKYDGISALDNVFICKYFF